MGVRKWEVMATKSEVSFSGVENALKLSVMMAAQLHESVVSLPGVFFRQVSAPPPYLNLHFSLPVSLSFFIFSSICNNLTCFI